MKIFFLGIFGIRISNAASNQIRDISRGLVENGLDTYLISIGLEYGEFRGNINNVNYYIPLAQKTRNNFVFVRIFFRIIRYIRLVLYLINFKGYEKKILIVYEERFSFFLYSYILKLLFFDKIVLYTTEYPFRKNNPYIIFNKKLYMFITTKIFDCYIFVSHKLRELYNIGKDLNSTIIPSVVAPSEFLIKEKSPFNFEYICYAGTITKEKDGVDILLKSFSKILKEDINIKLVLIGKFGLQNGKKEEFYNLVKRLKIERNVIFTGLIDYSKIPIYYNNAKILMLARPFSLQADTGFPRKLPEYLASGKPVIVSKVGDIPLYLKDRKNVFFVKPNDIEDLKKKMIYVLNNYSEAEKIGKEGRKIAYKTFNYYYQAKRLKENLLDKI